MTKNLQIGWELALNWRKIANKTWSEENVEKIEMCYESSSEYFGGSTIGEGWVDRKLNSAGWHDMGVPDFRLW